MEEQDTKQFKIFRAKDGRGLMQDGCMTVEPMTGAAREGMTKAMEAGMGDGEEISIVVNMPGFSIANVWFKPGYPLPLHSHSADCWYYIVAGGIRLGTEELGARDTFFIPAGVPYTYKPGPEGVELLEIRTSNTFDFVNFSKGEKFWEKAVESVVTNRESWKAAERPKIDA
ncbi:MAG: cupin domain-containing protein [Hyphomicrobiales bacterium]|nr:MAG: cupin domain-containing protein [Hyphomicrobiales bacterium]